MKKWLFRLIWIPAMLIAVLFLVANRQMVAISLDPFSAEAPALTSPALPLWFWLTTMLFGGLAIGAAGMWVSGRPKRVKLRAQMRELKTLRQDLAETKARLEAARSTERDSAYAPPLIESVDA